MTDVRLYLDVDLEKRTAISRIPLYDVAVNSENRKTIVDMLMDEKDPVIFVVHPDRIEVDMLFDFGKHIPLL
jgi:hypothetical protein